MSSGDDFVVPARRWAEIGGIANNIRHRLNLWSEPWLPDYGATGTGDGSAMGMVAAGGR